MVITRRIERNKADTRVARSSAMQVASLDTLGRVERNCHLTKCIVANHTDKMAFGAQTGHADRLKSRAALVEHHVGP